MYVCVFSIDTCVYVCIFMCVCVRAHGCNIHTYIIDIYACIYVYICVDIRICRALNSHNMCTRTLALFCQEVHMYVCMLCMYVCMLCMYVCMHA
jgi:hypothetical protein